MLSQMEKLSLRVDGRYATDEELKFLEDYVHSYTLRLQTYQKLQTLEATLVQQTQNKVATIDPQSFRGGQPEVVAKWKMDTVRVLRYSALALLLDDLDTLSDRFLFWFQTIMRAFNTQKSCHVTYEVMQTVAKQHLSATQASLFCPILEANRRILGTP